MSLPILIEIARLVLGVLIMAFHRRIGDHSLQMEQLFAGAFSARGMRYPALPKQSTAHAIYFCLGMAVCVIAMARLYGMLGR